MAKVHVLEMSDLKNTISVIYHIPVPSENNSVNISLYAALKQYLSREGATIGSGVPNLATDYPAELTQIQNGEVYEHQKQLDLDGKWTVAQRASFVDADYLASVTPIQTKIRNILNFWGAVRNPT